MNIYELPSSVNEAMERFMLNFNSETGEEETDSTESLKELEELQNKKDDLIEWMLKKRGNAEANRTALLNEMSRLNERVIREGKTMEAMEKMIRHFIPEAEKPLTISNWSISYRKSTQTIIDDEALIPDEYKTTETKTIEKISKDDIKKALKEGKKVSGAHLFENKTLTIK